MRLSSVHGIIAPRNLGPGELSQESELLENRTEKKTSGKIEIHYETRKAMGDDLKTRLSS